MNKIVSGIIVILGIFTQEVYSATNNSSIIECAWNQFTNQVPDKDWMDYFTLSESLNFDLYLRRPSYQTFACTISNNWQDALSSFLSIGTNETKRLAVLGVGKSFDDNFYIAYCNALADLQQRGFITIQELRWSLASSFTNLDTCLIRRYQEPQVTNLVVKLKEIFPNNSQWEDVLSGASYTNYLEEVEAGLWD